ncbi:transducin family protein/WD-40 repeat protein, partial [Trifolium medium]|nr:transducin family protein/WD-40 repeat protein [Trifolium medium]
MRWEVQKPVVAMEYSSPLQWRDKGKVVVAEAESISLWDVNSLSTQPLVSVPFVVGKQISALHVNNTDAELDGGVRR